MEEPLRLDTAGQPGIWKFSDVVVLAAIRMWTGENGIDRKFQFSVCSDKSKIINTGKPHYTGPTSIGYLPITNARFWCLRFISFNFLYWQYQKSVYNR